MEAADSAIGFLKTVVIYRFSASMLFAETAAHLAINVLDIA